ncbi:MAG: hypothetical protein F6K54_29865 [Okeania sp. SIO3B5]|uniref:hypothetical protein n=1 Tax=Okeania sp. SIO3B5 TaxID=2607811 RepID=UPI0013FF8EB5|nr:hypothetical protein [Okeania sp. SIO3B5]NEO56911.1 hypothetical protein [Okeania sp. SIO3B5]
MPLKQVPVTLTNLGDLIFWHEEILDFIRLESSPGTIPTTNRDFYDLIGFKPTFYSIHTAKIHEEEIRIIAFTRIKRNYYPETKIMVLRESGIPVNEKYKFTLNTMVTSYMNNAIDSGVSEKLFDQNYIAMKLYLGREMMQEKILRE